METEELLSKIYDLVIAYGLKVVWAIVTLVVGIIAIRLFKNLLVNILKKREVENAIIPFIVGLSATVLKILLGVSVLTMLGVEMTSFVAVLGAMGLGIGMALSGTLQNFAGGLMLILYKPFKHGDFIEMADYSGTVKRIQLFNTILNTPDNKTVFVPNSKASNSTLVNYTTEPKRRVDLVLGVSYESSIKQAREILLEVIEASPLIDKDPAPYIGVDHLGENAVNIVLRVWCNSGDFLTVKHETLERIKEAFEMAQVKIAKPQRDVHIYKHETS
ncbi:MAG: mechanosensitive ion channel [Cyclobacteriaceae bacterium]|nr:mechanosensitive ion channel [Cyclobacteriaceae bacterium]